MTGVLALGPCLAAVSLLPAASPQESEELLDELIQRSNGLKSFVAEYRFYPRASEDSEEIVPADVRIVYRAPGRARVTLSSDQGSMCMVIGEDRMFMRTRGWDSPSVEGSVELAEIYGEPRKEIVRLFKEQFPKSDMPEWAGGSGVFFEIAWKEARGSDRPKFSFTAGLRDEQIPLLGWLGRLRQSKKTAKVEDELLVYELDGGFLISVQKDSGFVSTASSAFEGETRTMLELVRLDLEAEVDSSEFAPLEADPSSQNISSSLRSQLFWSDLASLRRLFETSLTRMIESDQLEWNDEARSRLKVVLRAVHESFAPLLSTELVEWGRSAVDEFCLWYQQAKASIPEGDDASAADLEDKRITWEAGFRESADKAIAPYATRAVPEVEEAASEISSEVQVLELEVAQTACRKTVLEPVFEYLSEQMERARNGELEPTKR